MKKLSFLKGAFFLLPLLGVAVPYALPLWLCLTAWVGLGLAYFCDQKTKNAIKHFLHSSHSSKHSSEHSSEKKCLKISPLSALLTTTLLFMIWMGCSILWAPHFSQSFRLFGSLSALIASGIALCFLLRTLPTPDLKSLGTPFIKGTLIALAFLALDIFLKGSLRNALKTGNYALLQGNHGLMPYSQGSTFLAVVLWPLLGITYRFQKYLAAGIALLTPLLLTQLESHAAMMGVAVGLLVFFCVYALRKPALLFGSGLVFVVMITSPQLVVNFLDPVEIEESLPQQAKASYSHRLWIWRYVAHRAFERPLLGWGLDASRDKELKQSMLWSSERFCLKEGQKGHVDNCANESIPLHPHNLALQIWLELGVVGSILAGFLIALFPIFIAYLPISRFGKSLAASTYASTLIISFVAYGAWQNWWVATFLIGICLTGWFLKTEANKNGGKKDYTPST